MRLITLYLPWLSTSRQWVKKRLNFFFQKFRNINLWIFRGEKNILAGKKSSLYLNLQLFYGNFFVWPKSLILPNFCRPISLGDLGLGFHWQWFWYVLTLYFDLVMLKFGDTEIFYFHGLWEVGHIPSIFIKFPTKNF